MNHIAYLIPTLDRIGGAEQQVLLLAKGLAERGWLVSVIALAGTGRDSAHSLNQAGIAFHSLHMRKGLADPRGWLRLHAWLTRQNPDILHSHLPHATLLARYLRIASPVRALVDTIHSPATGGRARRIGFRLTTRMPDAVTAVSHSAAAPWCQSGLISLRNLTIIPNGIDMHRWKRDERARVQMRRELRISDQFLWLSVGRLDPVKDHATLLKSFAKLSSHSRLILAGIGPLESKLRTLTAELGLLDRVTLAGFQTDILPWMQAADGFVLCSRWEGLPVSLLEACACEVPAVITDIPGAREVLPHPLLSTAVAPCDPESLSAAMNTVMRQPEVTRRTLSRLVHASICDRFSIDRVLNQWEDLFRHLLAENPRPARFGNSTSTSRSTFQL